MAVGRGSWAVGDYNGFSNHRRPQKQVSIDRLVMVSGDIGAGNRACAGGLAEYGRQILILARHRDFYYRRVAGRRFEPEN